MPAFWTNVFAKIRLIGCGICVGVSDLVPGISGGTVAFIIGIYERLLQSIASIHLQSLLRLRLRSFFTAIHWHFLLPFLLGVSIAFITFANGITFLLQHESYRVYLYAGFMGLVVGSSFFCAKMLRGFSVHTLVCMLVGMLISYFLTQTTPLVQNETSYDVVLSESFVPKQSCCNVHDNKLIKLTPSELQAMLSKKYILPNETIYEHATQKVTSVSDVLHTKNELYFDLWLAVCGSFAISAMLLPGISGSYILQILGVYGLILSALVDFTQGLKMAHFDVVSFRILASCGLGILLGAILFSKLMQILLKHYRNNMLSIVIGFMLGALHVVWPFRTSVWRLDPLHLSRGPVLQPDALVLPTFCSFETIWACLIFVAAILLIFFMESLVSTKEKVYGSAAT